MRVNDFKLATQSVIHHVVPVLVAIHNVISAHRPGHIGSIGLRHDFLVLVKADRHPINEHENMTAIGNPTADIGHHHAHLAGTVARVGAGDHFPVHFLGPVTVGSRRPVDRRNRNQISFIVEVSLAAVPVADINDFVVGVGNGDYAPADARADSFRRVIHKPVDIVFR